MRRPARLGAACIVLAGACGSHRPAGGRISAAASVAPIASIVSIVGGGQVDVTGLIPEGVDSHTFQPRPSDARVLASAGVVFLNGLHLETPLRKLSESNLRKGARLVDLGARAVPARDWIYDSSFPPSRGDPNPHLWMDPVYARAYAGIVRDELTRLRPEWSAVFAAGYSRFSADTARLDAAIRQASATIPPPRRKILTYHDSFPYFAREYRWVVIGAIQPADFSEPTPREVAALIRQIRSEKVPAIFGSEVFPSPVLKQISRDSGATYYDNLRDDELPGAPGSRDHNYFGLIRFDIATIVRALGGEASALDSLDFPDVAGSGFHSV